jgi:hypothetical protein
MVDDEVEEVLSPEILVQMEIIQEAIMMEPVEPLQLLLEIIQQKPLPLKLKTMLLKKPYCMEK